MKIKDNRPCSPYYAFSNLQPSDCFELKGHRPGVIFMRTKMRGGTDPKNTICITTGELTHTQDNMEVSLLDAELIING